MRCDGLVVATPAGSTGYNLANGGPVLAWGVEGYVVSFIAPHTLTARALVVAPTTTLTCRTLATRSRWTSRRRPAGLRARARRARSPSRFEHDQGQLAQMPGSTFYHRLREKFGQRVCAHESFGRLRRARNRRRVTARSVGPRW